MASSEEVCNSSFKIKKYLSEHIQELSQVYVLHKKALENCEEEIDQWKKFIKDYNVLQEKLTKHPDKTSYDEVIPIGSLAYMKGRMIHTNEVLVHLGDNWFAERSVKDAVAIITRRKEVCKEKLKAVEKMKSIHEGWVKQTEELAKEGDQVQLLEQISEEKYQQSKEKRREMIATHLLVTGDSPVKEEDGQDGDSSISGEIKTFEDLLKKLDALEEEERLNDELELQENEEAKGNDDQTSGDADASSKGEKSETEEEGGTLGPKEKLRRRVSWADQLSEPKHDDDEEEEEGEETAHETPVRMKYRSRQQSLPTELISSTTWNKDEPESPSQENAEAAEGEGAEAPPELDSEGVTPQSPSDLYKMFGPHAIGGQPTKGILKKKGESFQTDDIEKGVGFCDTAESIEYIPCSPDEPVVFRTPPLSESPKEIKNLKPAFSYKVVARNADNSDEEDEEEDEEEEEVQKEETTQPEVKTEENPKEEPKHVSRFKAVRMKKAEESTST